MAPDKHAILGASSAARWLECPPSALICAGRPRTSSLDAEKGTLAHALGELKLRKLFGNGTTPMKPSVFKTELEKIKQNPLYDPEMDRCTDDYVQHVQEVVMGYTQRPLLAFEQEVDYSEYAPDGFGTADCIVLTPDTLHVMDYKHGQGVPVRVENNPQLKLYGLGALLLYQPFYPNVSRVVLHVIQPRVDGVSFWELSKEELLRWAEEYVKPRATLAAAGQGEFNPGETQCRWCSINGSCRARAEKANKVAALPQYKRLPPELTDLEVAEALTLGASISDWIKKLEAHAEKSIQAGKEIPGFKLVSGRANRAWDNQALAFSDLKSAGVDESFLYERVPLTVAKLEKTIEKHLFAQVAAPHITVPIGKPTLVPATDPRPAWSAAKNDFAAIINKNQNNQ